MPAPPGLGWWVAFESEATKGGKMDDLRSIIDRAKATGATWIAPRASAGGKDDGALFLPDGRVNETSLRAYVDAGLQVYPWIFAYRQTQRGELTDWRALAATGLCAGAIINAEFEYAGVGAAQAKSLVHGIREAGFDFVAHAPPDYYGSTGGPAGYDEWDALDEVCDAIMPQVYAWEHDDRGHVFHLARVLAKYSARGYRVDGGKLWPILCSYRPRVRGFTADKKSIPIPSMVNEAAVVAADLVLGLDTDMLKGCRAPSIYSLDALSFAMPNGEKVITALVERADRIALAEMEAARTVPSPPHDGIPDGATRAANPVMGRPGEHDPTDS